MKGLTLALLVCNLIYVVSSECPNYQYSCEHCPSDSECIYPNSGGCIGAGIPICRKKNACNHIYCRILAQPCPKDCPYDCQYNNTSCCPLASKPVCKPECLTIQECVVTPCPEECAHECFYPNANFCCPKSGQPVCKKPW